MKIKKFTFALLVVSAYFTNSVFGSESASLQNLEAQIQEIQEGLTNAQAINGIEGVVSDSTTDLINKMSSLSQANLANEFNKGIALIGMSPSGIDPQTLSTAKSNIETILKNSLSKITDFTTRNLYSQALTAMQSAAPITPAS